MNSLKVFVETLKQHPEKTATYGEVASALEPLIHAPPVLTGEQLQMISSIVGTVAAVIRTHCEAYTREENAKLKAELLPHLAQ